MAPESRRRESCWGGREGWEGTDATGMEANIGASCLVTWEWRTGMPVAVIFKSASQILVGNRVVWREFCVELWLAAQREQPWLVPGKV